MKKIIIFLVFISFYFDSNSQTTIITHGFQPSGGSSPVLGWMLNMAEAIRTREGNDCSIRIYNKATGDFDLYSGTDSRTILLFDWHDESNDPETGHSEAAGAALFAALLQGDQKGTFGLNNLHLIGHSRGTVVNSEAVERLLVAGYSVEHVTYLDAHDWGTNYSQTDFDVNPNGSGIEGWNGIAWADSYWQDSPYTLSGRPVDGTYSLYLGTIGHSQVHEWYLQTILDSTLEEGYFWTLFGGGSALRPPISGTSANPFFIFETDGIVNGDFQRGTWNDFSAQPGWAHHGGGGNAHIDYGYLEMDYGSTYYIHDRLFIPPNASKIKFDLDITNIDSGVPFEVDKFYVKVGNDVVYSIWLNQYSGGYQLTSTNVIPYQNSVQTLELRIVDEYGGTYWINSEVRIDNLQIELAPSTGISETIATLEESFKIFPNPLNSDKGNLTISLNANIDDPQLIIYDQLGAKVLLEKIKGNKDLLHIENLKLAPGFYIATLSNATTSITQKLIVK